MRIRLGGAGNTAYFEALLAVIIWGGSFASTKTALAEATPMMVLWIRLLIGMPVLLVGMWLQGAVRLPTRREALPLAFMGFQGILFHQGLQGYAMQTAGTGNANWLMSASPAVVAFLGWMLLRERISHKGILGLAVSSIGVAMVLGWGTLATTTDTASVGFGNSGDLMILASVLNWGVFLILARRFLSKDLPSGFVIFWEMGFALVMGTPFLILIDGNIWPAVLEFSVQTWGAIIFLGCFSSALAYMLWFHALSSLPVARVTAFQFLQPVVGAFLGYFVMGERFTVWLFVGGALIIAGVLMVTKD